MKKLWILGEYKRKSVNLNTEKASIKKINK